MRYVVLGLIALALVEAWVASRWWAPYFTTGLVVYRRSFPRARSAPSLPGVDALARRFRSGLGPSLVFSEVGPAEIAFREKLFELKLIHYTPVMHGLLRLRPESSEIEVQGRANWSTLAFSVVFSTSLWGFSEAWLMLGFLVALLVGIGSIQARLYSRVGRFAAAGAATAEFVPERPVTPAVVAVTAIAVALAVGIALWWMAN